MEYDESLRKKHIAEITLRMNYRCRFSILSQRVIGYVHNKESMRLVSLSKSKRPTDGSGCSFHQTFVGKERVTNPEERFRGDATKVQL